MKILGEAKVSAKARQFPHMEQECRCHIGAWAGEKNVI